MIFSKSTFLKLPKVNKFSFDIKNLIISNLNPVSFTFIDENLNTFPFLFSGGFIFTDKIISVYNTKNASQIKGYFENSLFKYQIDEIYGSRNKLFNKLYGINIQIEDSLVSCDLFLNSNPINYNLNFNSTYNGGDVLTGNFYSDVEFDVNNYYFKYFNSNPDLLSLEKSPLSIGGGDSLLTLKDIDNSDLEYDNSFLTYADTIFGTLNFDSSSYRSNLYSKGVLNIVENPFNNYNSSSIFSGYWSGNDFIFSGGSGNIAEINIDFNLINTNRLGEDKPIYGYAIFWEDFFHEKFQRIDKFELTNGGLYSGKEPALEFSKYYYVEGINKDFINLLFSTGCSNYHEISFLQTVDDKNIATYGYLKMRDVLLSGFYGDGINKFKAVFGYDQRPNLGFTGAPLINWNTGSNCFSIPDVYGESGQFKKVHNSLAKIKTHANYLTGYVLTSGITNENQVVTGYIVTGVKTTNIGSGYSQFYPAKIYFKRDSEDKLTNDASGVYFHKNLQDIELSALEKSKDLTFETANGGGVYDGKITTGFSFYIIGYKDIEDKRLFSFPLHYSGTYYGQESNPDYYINFGWKENPDCDGYLFKVDMRYGGTNILNVFPIWGDPYFNETSFNTYGAFLDKNVTGITIAKTLPNYIEEVEHVYETIDVAKYPLTYTTYTKIYSQDELGHIRANSYSLKYNFFGENEVYFKKRMYSDIDSGVFGYSPAGYFYSEFKNTKGNKINFNIKQNLDVYGDTECILFLRLADFPLNMIEDTNTIPSLRPGKTFLKKINFNKNFSTETGFLT